MLLGLHILEKGSHYCGVRGAWCDLLGSSRFWGDDPLSAVAGSTSVAGNV